MKTKINSGKKINVNTCRLKEDQNLVIQEPVPFSIEQFHLFDVHRESLFRVFYCYFYKMST